MDRRVFMGSSLAALAVAGPARAGKLSLDDISSYVNGIKAAQSEFTQINDDGSISTGQFYIRRPGRMRFEYNPPDNLLVIAGGGQVAIFDGKSNIPQAEKYPLRRTPLNLILEERVNLARRNMVVGHEFDWTATIVVAQDPEHPEYGSISLKFTENPVELRQWIVTDGQGARTTVILGQLKPAENLSPGLFSIVQEEQARGG